MGVGIARESEPAVAKAFWLGSLIGFVVTFLVFAGISLAVGLSPLPAAGIGLFTAFWGGPGFGGMVFAVTRYSKAELH